MIPSVPCRPASLAFVPLQFSGRAGEVLDAAARIGGLAVLATAIAGAVAIAFRWYARERVSNPPAILLGVAVVAAYLNATTALGQVMGGQAALSARVALFNVSALVAATVAGIVGITVGDRLARTVLGDSDQIAVDRSLGRVVRAVGRVIAVELPAEIEDVPGYDPIDPETKATLAGKSFVFPRGLTVEELRERMRRRLREDYRVGHVDVEIEEDGSVTHLGLGSRAAGIGPTLPPESAAMAIRADPAHAASAGDLVQVWTINPHRRLLNAEVRGTAGEVVTLAIDAADASKLDTDERYKLVTLPVEERADRELTELLRAAEETLGVIEIPEGSPLAGTPLGALDLTVVAVHGGGPDDRIEALPARDRVLTSGDSLYMIARPAVIRRIESAAGAGEQAGERASSTIPSDREPRETKTPPETDVDEGSSGDDASEETAEGTSDKRSPDGPAIEPTQAADTVAESADDDGDETTVATADAEAQQPDRQADDEPEQAAESQSDDVSEENAESSVEPLFGETAEEDSARKDRDESPDETDRGATDDSMAESGTTVEGAAEEDETTGEDSEGDIEDPDMGLFETADKGTSQDDGWATEEDIEQGESPSEDADEGLEAMDDLTEMEELPDLDDSPDVDEDSADGDRE